VHHQQLQLQQQRERHEKQLKQQQEAMQPPGSRLPSFDPHGSRPGSYDPHASRPASYDPHANRPGSYDPHARPPSYERGMGMGGVPNSSGGGGMMGGISGSLGGVGLVGGTGLRVSLDAGQGGSLASSATSLTTGSDASARQSKELMMSPKTRAVYKAFSHRLRSKETQGKGMAHASELARRCLAELP
jgi:hypothetical protein